MVKVSYTDTDNVSTQNRLMVEHIVVGKLYKPETVLSRNVLVSFIIFNKLVPVLTFLKILLVRFLLLLVVFVVVVVEVVVVVSDVVSTTIFTFKVAKE